MKCPRCQAGNREGLRFCEDCGARLAAICPFCGAEVTPGKKFCGSCGTPSSTVQQESRYASPQTYTPKSLVILGDAQVTNPGNRPRGAMLRAYDKVNGKEVGAIFIPSAQGGSPMSYEATAGQYTIVAVSGGTPRVHRLRAAELGGLADGPAADSCRRLCCNPLEEGTGRA